MRDIRTRRTAGIQYGWREVQTRRRSGNRATFFGEDGLITFAVGGIRRPMDVGRQGNFTETVDEFFDRLCGVEMDDALSELAVLRDQGVEVVAEKNAIANLGALAGLDERLPYSLARIERANEEDFNFGAVMAVAAAMQTGGKHARIIQDEAIAWA